MIVYRIVNKTTGKTYIGCTVRSLKDRWNQHCWKNSHNRLLHSDIKKYGREVFFIESLGEYKNSEIAHDAESYYIDFYNCISPNGYNLASGGKTPKMHEETKKIISSKVSGSKNGMFGIVRSLESRLEQSKKTKGRPLSETHKAALRKPKSEAHKEKLREHLKRLAVSGANNRNKTRDLSGKFQKSK